MTRHLATTLAIVGAAAAISGATTRAQTPSPTPSPKTLTLRGCVAGDATVPDRFNLTEDTDGITYRLSGADVRRYVGQRVQVTGGVESKRLHIAGGLVPSANAAGQAGAMDPAQAAMAASTPGANSAQLPTFKVARVRTVAGECPER